MTHDTPAHPLDWHRFAGAFATVAVPASGGDIATWQTTSGVVAPTIGTAFYCCECCGRQYLVVAAIAGDGSEVNVSLPLPTAIDFLERATELVHGAVAEPARTVQ